MDDLGVYMEISQTKHNGALHFFLLILILPVSLLIGLAQASELSPVRFGVLSIAQPARIFAEWTPFVKYLEMKLDRPAVIVVPKGFAKMKQAVANKEVDIFYINSYVFYRLMQDGQALAVGQMQNIAGKVVSQSEIFVRTDSGIASVGELKGKSIAFVSLMGAGGYLAPRAYLKKQGVNVSEEVESIFTNNLSSSLHQVLLGTADAGAMCGVNYSLMAKKIDSGELKVVGVSDDYPENVIAARHDLEPALIKRLTDVILSMAQNERGKQLLDNMHDMKIQSFVPYQEKIEQITQSLLESANLEP